MYLTIILEVPFDRIALNGLGSNTSLSLSIPDEGKSRKTRQTHAFIQILPSIFYVTVDKRTPWKSMRTRYLQSLMEYNWPPAYADSVSA